MNSVRFQYPIFQTFPFLNYENTETHKWIDIATSNVPRVGDYVCLPVECVGTSQERLVKAVSWNFNKSEKRPYDLLVLLV